MATTKNIKTLAYGKYQLYWMLTHGWTFDDIAKRMGYILRPGEYYDSKKIGIGFNGEIWSDFEDFLSDEYKNEDLMKILLTKSEFEKWKKDREEDAA